MTISLNCDLGESYGAWSMGADADVMPHIHQANIACGYHAGDPSIMQRTLALAKAHGVTVGAHPSYPDRAGFGRRSMACSEDEIRGLIHYQLAALDGLARVQGLTVAYVKPHGALYNDMMANADTRRTIMSALADWHTPIALMLQATLDADQHRREAQPFGLALIFEAFADRAYQDNGLLVPRREQGAVLSKTAMLQQATQLHTEGRICSIHGRSLPLQVDSLCVHGDNPEGVAAIAELRALLES